ncbi:TonB-dependent receptor [Steroidobacter flavus]|uniref:TonB-dependent receptor n=1 Tax=Steroidobacter flavus TaxID=1842136 RepID=A0ABV8SSD6_9GAMM
MLTHSLQTIVGRSLLLTPLALAGPALAQTVLQPESPTQLEEMLVTARKSATAALPINVAADSVERSQIEAMNVINAEDALRYVSNVQIRKRYIGDANGAPASRGTSAPQAARSQVLMDGIPISNLLGSGFLYAPKWGLLAPDEIESIDVMYGPFSALYSGNTLGTGIFVTTHMPEKFEMSLGALDAYQNFRGYETDLSLNNRRYDASIGSRAGNVSWAIYANHLEAEGNPANFLTVPVSTGTLVTGTTPVDAIAASGAIREIDAGGIDRYLFGTSSTFDDTTDVVKGKVKWDIDEDTRLFATLAYQEASSQLLNHQSYLRDANGNQIIRGRVQIGDRVFNLNNLSILQLNVTASRNLLAGATLQKRFDNRWLIEASASGFDVLDGDVRTATMANAPNGQVNETDDQGWRNGALRAIYTPDAVHWLGKTLVLGTDYGRYWNQNSAYQSPNWRAGMRGTLAERNRGETRQTALFGENTWGLGSAVDVTLGLRYEDWQARDGLRTLGALSIDYPERSEQKWSPKATLTWRTTPELTVQTRAARAYRFPTVTELFQSRTTGGYLVQSDPNLKPEDATTFDVSLTRRFDLAGGRAKASVAVFSEDVKDAIFNQYNVFQQATFNTSIGRVLTRGLELNLATFGMFAQRVDLDANLVYQQSEIRDNPNNPATVGNDFPRIPNWRGKLLATWRPLELLSASIGLAYEGKQYNLIDNSDDRSGGYGYMSEYFLVDLKASYQLTGNIEASLGIDNVTDELVYYYHPYPRRTYSASLRWRMR